MVNVLSAVQGLQAGLAVAGVRLPSIGGLFNTAQVNAWRASLQPASWRGVPFFVEVAEMQAGRNTAAHAYPFRSRDPVWIEDVGLAPTSTRIVGFLIGDNVAEQQNFMLSAMQSAGPGPLVHPMRGSLTGSVVGGCRFLLRKDRGRYIEITFEFVEGTDFNPYPLAGSDTGGQVKDAASTAATASNASTDAAAPTADRSQAQTEAAAVNADGTRAARISKSPAEARQIGEDTYFAARADGASGAQATLRANAASQQARSYMTVRQDRLNGYTQ